MSESKTNTELVEHTLNNPEATQEELLLAERLFAAIEELDRVTALLKAQEEKNGSFIAKE